MTNWGLTIIDNIRSPFCHKLAYSPFIFSLMTGDVSKLILNCWIVEGIPMDVDPAKPMLDRQKQLYDRYPLKGCFDEDFASKDYLKLVKSRRFKDVCFAKSVVPIMRRIYTAVIMFTLASAVQGRNRSGIS